MTTENTQPAGVIAVHPLTGEAVDLAAAKPAELADALDRVNDAYERLADYKAAVIAELARRADNRATRTVEAGGVKWQVNAPTEDQYEVSDVEAELAPLVEAGKVAPELVRELVVYPEPAIPAPRVDKRRLAAVLKSDNRELLAALARARRRVPTKRTAKIVARAVEGTATDA